MSSPRGANGKGFIEILDSKLKRLHLIDGEQVFNGFLIENLQNNSLYTFSIKKFGSYFGASVLAE